ncbi:MAG: NUDIX domain-containing protein [Candidatus Moranbacteria bacterium]|nr:NUDIX domain-containing protein [Candidatus Moranbacteria bacterium]
MLVDYRVETGLELNTNMITCEFENGNSTKNLRHVTVEAIIEKKGRILLTKRAKHLVQGGKYCIPGGFLDKGENTKEGILREVREETGYQARIIDLFQIVDEPNRNDQFNQNVSFVYLVEMIKQLSEPDNEVDELAWFTLDKLPPGRKIAFDHAKRIKKYADYRKNKFKLPVFT